MDNLFVVVEEFKDYQFKETKVSYSLLSVSYGGWSALLFQCFECSMSKI